MRANDISEIAKLSTQEKIMLVEDLWDNIRTDNSHIPVPKSHQDELDRRFKKYKSNPENLLSLKELQARIEKRK